MNTKTHDQGFTLLEVLIALMIAGSALVMMYSSLETGLHSGRQADLSLHALSIARSRLEAVQAVSVLSPGTTTEDSGNGWQTTVEIHPIRKSEIRNTHMTATLYDITVTAGRNLLHKSVHLSARAVRSTPDRT